MKKSLNKTVLVLFLSMALSSCSQIIPLNSAENGNIGNKTKLEDNKISDMGSINISNFGFKEKKLVF